MVVKKYQFHAESQSFKNEVDEQIGWRFGEDSESTMRKINASQGLYYFLTAKFPVLYDEDLFFRKGYVRPNDDDTEYYFTDAYTWEHYFEYYYEFGHEEKIYFMAKEDRYCILFCLNQAGKIVGSTPVIGKNFQADEIIPFKTIDRQNELVIKKKGYIGIFYFHTGEVRWGYKGVVPNQVDWVKSPQLR